MKKFFKVLLIAVVICSVLCCSVSAKVYDESFPEDSVYSFSNWIDAEVDGIGHCYVYLCDCFSDKELHLSNPSVGFIAPMFFDVDLIHYPYMVDSSYQVVGIVSFVGSNEFSSIYYYSGVLYLDSNYSTPLCFSDIYDTNMKIVDNYGDLSNDNLKFTQTEKILIVIAVLLAAILLFYILRSAWRA